MLGIFDSGMGGAFALFEYRRLFPNEPVCFFADKGNLPYGEKSREELIALVMKDIDILRDMGADRIIMACCTASTVYPYLPDEYRREVIPIIEPAANAAVQLSKNGKIGVISTAATARSGAFPEAVKALRADADVISVFAPELVSLAERGERDGKLSENGKNIIRKSLIPFEKSGIDTLILGCTHFAYFEREIENIIGVNTVNAARVSVVGRQWSVNSGQ